MFLNIKISRKNATADTDFGLGRELCFWFCLVNFDFFDDFDVRKKGRRRRCGHFELSCRSVRRKLRPVEPKT